MALVLDWPLNARHAVSSCAPAAPWPGGEPLLQAPGNISNCEKYVCNVLFTLIPPSSFPAPVRDSGISWCLPPSWVRHFTTECHLKLSFQSSTVSLWPFLASLHQNCPVQWAIVYGISNQQEWNLTTCIWYMWLARLLVVLIWKRDTYGHFRRHDRVWIHIFWQREIWETTGHTFMTVIIWLWNLPLQQNQTKLNTLVFFFVYCFLFFNISQFLLNLESVPWIS